MKKVVILMLYILKLFCTAVSVTELCNITRENCISKPRNSTCINNGTYLNYTNDIEFLLQLEYEAMNFIEANVTNQYCRNYLKVALCVTIYPPCDDSGVQKLCSEVCDSLLSSGACSLDARYVTKFTSNKASNSDMNFTIDCSHSLSFSSKLLSTVPCQSNKCVSLIEVAETPVTCTHLESFGENVCSPYVLSNMIFKYTSDMNFRNFVNTGNRLINLLDTFGEKCQLFVLQFFCNIIFVPCNLTIGAPMPFCSNVCFGLDSFCGALDSLMVDLVTVNNIPYISNCENTLSHLNTDFNYPNSSSDFTDDCLHLPGFNHEQYLSTIIETSKSISIINHLTSNTDIINSTSTIINTTVRAYSSIIDNINNNASDIDIMNNMITSSMSNNITDEAAGYTNNNPTKIAVILCCVSVGLLGLFFVVCIVGLFMKRRHTLRKNDIKRHKFTSAVFNPFSHRMVIEMMNNTEEKRKLTDKDMETLKKEYNLNSLLIPKSEIKLITELGKGEFGQVYKGIWIYKNACGNTISEVVAVKTVKDCCTLENLKTLLNESILMKNFEHPNVLNILGVGLDAETRLPFVLLPFMVNRDLKSYLESKLPISSQILKESNLFDICYQIACGMKYLAAKRFVHCDLAARNCMVGEKLNIKIADFGLAKDVYMTDYYRQQSIERMPVKWMAPEAMNDRISNEKTDVWSYGITCWEVFSLGQTPYPTVPNHEILQYIDEGNRPPKPKLCSDYMYSLLLKCWEADVEKRPCFREIEMELSDELSKGYVNDTLDGLDC